ncbi:MAG: DUF2807 domain-containing protein [Salibacteraceae bacterium]
MGYFHDICVMKVPFTFLIAGLIISLNACRDRCKTTEGSRQRFEVPLFQADRLILNSPAEMNIRKNDTVDGSLEILAQQEVFGDMNISTNQKVCEINLVGCFKNNETTLIDGHFQQLRGAELNSAGYIKSSRLIKQDSVELTNDGLGDIDLVLKSNYIEAKIASSGNILLHGETDHLLIASLGSGEVSAFGLYADSVIIRNYGTGVIDVHASKYLEVEFGKSTTVQYRGNPGEVIVIGEGDLINANF